MMPRSAHARRLRFPVLVRAQLLATATVFGVSGITLGQPGGEARAVRTIAGVVRDSTDRPIQGVEVVVSGRPPAITDSLGRFHIGDAPLRPVAVTFRRLGYEPAMRTVASGADDSLLAVVLTPNAQLLHTILVEGRAYDEELWKNGFYHRQKIGSGSFFDPEFLMHFGGSGVGAVLHEVPRVEVERRNGQEYAFSTIGGNRCRMNVFLDGVFQRAVMPGPSAGASGSSTGGSDALGLGELVDFHDIRAIEVYPRANFVPTQFTRMGPAAGPQGRPMPRIPSRYGISAGPSENQDAACGAIVIWTKTPGAP